MEYKVPSSCNRRRRVSMEERSFDVSLMIFIHLVSKPLHSYPSVLLNDVFWWNLVPMQTIMLFGRKRCMGVAYRIDIEDEVVKLSSYQNCFAKFARQKRFTSFACKRVQWWIFFLIKVTPPFLRGKRCVVVECSSSLGSLFCMHNHNKFSGGTQFSLILHFLFNVIQW